MTSKSGRTRQGLTISGTNGFGGEPRQVTKVAVSLRQ